MNLNERAFWSNPPSHRHATRGKAKAKAKTEDTSAPAPDNASVSKPSPASATVSEQPISAPVSQPTKSGAPGQALAAQRRVIAHICLQCEAEFTGIVIAVYCSNRCRQRAKNRRRAEAITAPLRPTNGEFFE